MTGRQPETFEVLSIFIKSRRWRHGDEAPPLIQTPAAHHRLPAASVRTHAEGLMPVSRMKAREKAGWLP